MGTIRTLLLIAILAAAGCGEDGLTIRGYLLPGSDATDVYVVGHPIRATVVGDSFLIAGVPRGTVELEFVDRDERLGRMRLEGWTRSPLELRDIWVDDGTAFAARLSGAGAVEVNGIRMAADAELPSDLAVEGVVLAASRRGDALIVRPLEEGLPDLRVVVTPGTALELGTDEGEFDPGAGDRLWIQGAVESGYVVATRVQLSPAGADPSAGSAEIGPAEGAVPPTSGDGFGEGDGDLDEDREGPRSLVRPGGGRGRGRGIQPRD